MFKVRDKVVCVKVEHFSKPIANGLIVGKIYDILDIRQSAPSNVSVFFIMDDIGNSFGFSSERFVSIAEFRKMKLKKICSKLEIK